MKMTEKCPECGGHLDLVFNEYVRRAVCAKCNAVFKVRVKLVRLYTGKQKKA